MPKAPAVPDGPPFVGALLRLCLEQVRTRMRDAARDAGFTDLQDAHWALLTHPVPDGVRPSELARRGHMSRQAANHLIAQLESLGYFERRSPGDASRRLVYLTPRGRALCEAIWDCLRGIHVDWAEQVGADRFATTLAVLRELAGQACTAPAR